MTYTYDDIVTAKDILTGKVKKEDIIGKKGWFFNCLPIDLDPNTLYRIGSPRPLGAINVKASYPFISSTGFYYFLPEKEKSYEERQEEWIAANNIKLGDKVRILRKAEDGEEGWGNVWGGSNADKTVGKIGIIHSISLREIRVDTDTNWFWYPYFVLEKVEDEPEYAPFDFSKEEDRNAIRGQWVKDKRWGNEWLVSGFYIDETGGQGWKAKLVRKNAGFSGEALMERFTFLDGSVIGKPANKEEL